MSGSTSYNDKVVQGEVEYPATDPASGAFFQPDYKKNDDLKLMLDGSKDSLKLEAMKRIIGMIAKGRDASELFPAVVKNVVSKNIEVKKLVYVYLVRYAEEQQDLALLSISTFQRALKDPNQLIRASALRVLSSIRVPMIVPIVMLAIRDSAADMSPYVRKTAAHAIPKLYSLDPDQKEELVAIIDKLLSDKAPLVVGSAAMAFSEVCPDRMTLIHRSYRKLCSLLADVDEWGQLALLNVLTVYARSCFPDPNNEVYTSDSESDKPFYDSDSESGTPKKHATRSPTLDADHRLLLRAAKPLLQSRNSGVVMAVAQLFYHCGPAQELPPVAKAMIRLLRAPLEVQSVVLNSIASLTVSRRTLFEPYLKSFFIRNSDHTHIKLLKLEILTNLATEATAGIVLREFQTYVTSNDKAFAGATIQAIGRLASNIHTETETCLQGLLQLLSSKDASLSLARESPLKEMQLDFNWATEATAGIALREFQTYVTSNDKAFAGATIQAIGRLASNIHTETETCLQGLLQLLSSKDEWVVCEAVVVVKRVVGAGAGSARGAVARAAKLLRGDRVGGALGGAARAAAVWLVAEHGAHHPRAAAVLAHMASDLADQEELVKLQLLSLAVKLSITQPDTLPVCRYILSLARYDASFDVRDRARMLRRFIEPKEGSLLASYAAEIFCPDKPKPTVQSAFKDRQQYTIGTLSQYIGSAASGYRPLPTAPAATVGASLRDTTPKNDVAQQDTSNDTQKNKTFYSEPESSGSGSGSSSEDSSSDEHSSEGEESTNDNGNKREEKQIAKKVNNYRSSSSASGSEDSASDSESSSGGSSQSVSSSEEASGDEGRKSTKEKKEVANQKQVKLEQKIEDTKKMNDKSNLELLLELDEVAGSLPTMTPTCGGLLSPAVTAAPVGGDADAITPVGPSLTPTATTELISRVVSGGLAGSHRWARAPHLFSHKMCAIELVFTNHSHQEVTAIRVNKKTLTGSRAIHDFAPIPVLSPGASASAVLGVDFADSIQPIEFTIISSLGEVSVSITPPVGELMRAVTMSEARWDREQRKLRGMTECDKKAPKLEDEETTCRKVFETANLAAITSSGDLLRFAGKMMSSQDLVLLSVKIGEDSSKVVANCPNMAIASMLANEVAQALSRS